MFDGLHREFGGIANRWYSQFMITRCPQILEFRGIDTPVTLMSFIFATTTQPVHRFETYFKMHNYRIPPTIPTSRVGYASREM